MPDGNCTALLDPVWALGKYRQILSIYSNRLRHLCGGKISGFLNFCFSSPIWLQRKVRFIDLIIFCERCKLSWSFHSFENEGKSMFMALYSVFIFRLFSDKPPSENQDEGSIGDSGEHQSDESRFRSQVKIRCNNVTTGFATCRIRYPLVCNTFVTCYFL